jgi:hypothetical protein
MLILPLYRIVVQAGCHTTVPSRIVLEMTDGHQSQAFLDRRRPSKSNLGLVIDSQTVQWLGHGSKRLGAPRLLQDMEITPDTKIEEEKSEKAMSPGGEVDPN